MCDAAGEQQSHSVLPDGAGGVFITWNDWRPERLTPLNGDIGNQRMVDDGSGGLYMFEPESNLGLN